MTKQTGQFRATGDDGQKYTVFIFTHTFHSKDGTSTESQELITDEGLLVKRLGRGEYQVVSSGVKLTSTDRAAP